MATAMTKHRPPETFAELWHQLGDVPLERIPMLPYPGTATVKDVASALEAANKRLFELVDGVLVEKAMGFIESFLANRLSYRISIYLSTNNLGILVGADGAMEIMVDLVRIPDLSFISWDDMPGEDLPDEPVPELVPRLAVEVISKSNASAEMKRKLRDYFEAGVRLVWFIYPKTQSAEVYTSPTNCRKIGKSQALDGGDVLPGFKLLLKDLFAPARGCRSRR